MPSFSTKRKVEIEQLLVGEAAKQFVAKGLMKTSIEELCDHAGIAKSSFYSFFASKEALYLELLSRESPKIEHAVWQAVNGVDTPAAKLRAYMDEMFRQFESNLLIQRLITHPEEMVRVRERVTPEFMEQKQSNNLIPLERFPSELQKHGSLIDLPPPVIAAVLRSGLLMVVHREDIGPEYQEVRKHIVRAITQYLVK